jgi:4-hydroxyphenylpyruvate dioxygenase
VLAYPLADFCTTVAAKHNISGINGGESEALLPCRQQRRRARAKRRRPGRATGHPPTAAAFSRSNPLSDRFAIKSFHHIEFYCGDALTTSSRFSWGLGLPLVSKSDQSTGNQRHASYLLACNEVRFLFTAPYATHLATGADTTRPIVDATAAAAPSPLPGFDAAAAHDFFRRHGCAARAIGMEVEDAAEAYAQCTANGGAGVLPPTDLGGGVTVSEVQAYGNVVLRFLSFAGGADSDSAAPFSGAFLPGFVDVPPPAPTATWPVTYGLQRIDHAVGNVWNMAEAAARIRGMTGMHPFAEFTAEDVGTGESGLNSVVLASNSEMVLLPINEPTYGTRRKSQIQVKGWRRCA